MSFKYSNLLSQIRVGNTILRNRIITPPTGMPSHDFGCNYPTEGIITHLSNRAKGGAALVTCGSASIFPVEVSRARGSDYWDLYEWKPLNAMAHMAERIQMYGAKASCELFDGDIGTRYSVSDGVPLPTGVIGSEMPEEEMHRIIDAYAYAAGAVKNVGFDCVYLHFGHGWQIAQFLSPLTNFRKDKYGGSLENRARYPKMIIDAVRNAVGKDMLIEVRISGSELEPGGFDLDESIEFVTMVQDQLDMINVSAGIHNTKWFTTTHPCGFLPPTPNVYLAEAFKKSGKIKIPVIAVGGIQDLEAADRIIADGKADIVAIARGFIADMELGTKAYEDRGEDVRPCIKCMRCHDSSILEHHYLCAINPMIGVEHALEKSLKVPKTLKKVAVVGGGPAGIQAALTLAERGHRVTLFEKSGKLGGTIGFADYVSFKYPLKNYKDFIVRQIEKAPIDVRLNTQATPDILKQQGFDAVLVAVGAQPVVPKVPGIENACVQFALDVYGKEDTLGESVVVVGGGQVGCETALHLAKLGKKVTIIEMLPDLAPDASPTHRNELINELNWEKNLVFITGAKCERITETGIEYGCVSGAYTGVHEGEDKNASRVLGAAGAHTFKMETGASEDTVEGNLHSLDADDIVIAAGMKSRSEESYDFIGSADVFIMLGDCNSARTIENAVKEGFYAAINL